MEKEHVTELVVYYTSDKPDTIYKVHYTSDITDKTFVTIEGYWMPEDNGSDKPVYHFVENKNKRPMLIDKQHLINHIVPDASAVKSFETMNDFVIDQL